MRSIFGATLATATSSPQQAHGARRRRTGHALGLGGSALLVATLGVGLVGPGAVAGASTRTGNRSGAHHPQRRAHQHAGRHVAKHAGPASASFLAATTGTSFAVTIARLKTAVSSAGMMELGHLNQAGALSVTGLHLKGAESFFVGNPTTGKKLFAMDPAVGAVIPVRMYVWVNGAGRTELGYFQPSALAKAVSPRLAKPVAMLDGAAASIVRSATGHAVHRVGVARGLRFVHVASPTSFAVTIARLKTAVSSAGMMELGHLNQAGALSVTGLHLKGAESFFVGNPTTGKKLFAMDSAVGIEIPLGMYLWVNRAGRTEIGYFRPAGMLTAVSSKFKTSAAMFDKVAARIAHKAR